MYMDRFLFFNLNKWDAEGLDALWLDTVLLECKGAKDGDEDMMNGIESCWGLIAFY